jgi:hypothetical protein
VAGVGVKDRSEIDRVTGRRVLEVDIGGRTMFTAQSEGSAEGSPARGSGRDMAGCVAPSLEARQDDKAPVGAVGVIPSPHERGHGVLRQEVVSRGQSEWATTPCSPMASARGGHDLRRPATDHVGGHRHQAAPVQGEMCRPRIS